VDRDKLQALAQEMDVDLANIEFRVTRDLPDNILGMMWEENGKQILLINEDAAYDGTLTHEMAHAKQAVEGYWRPSRLGYEAYAARMGDALEWKYRGILIREA